MPILALLSFLSSLWKTLLGHWPQEKTPTVHASKLNGSAGEDNYIWDLVLVAFNDPTKTWVGIGVQKGELSLKSTWLKLSLGNSLPEENGEL